MSVSKKKTIATDRLLTLHETMLVIRHSEAALANLFADGEIPGFIHLSLGQEAVAAGICDALEPMDTLATTHRGHGHVIARGMDLESFFKELAGRAGGMCAGRSGSMHVADLSLGILGANGIVGAGIPLALGSALAHQVRGTGGLAVAFFGDGAMAEGALYEFDESCRALAPADGFRVREQRLVGIFAHSTPIQGHVGRVGQDFRNQSQQC